jgi:DNA repair protein RadC
MVHNHPSGDPTPSNEDINITKRIAEAGKIIGIELVDHIIIGDGRYISLKEKGGF